MAGEVVLIENQQPINPSGASTDDRVMEMWLAGKAEKTRTRYGFIIDKFLKWIDKGLREVTLSDLHYYKAMIEDEYQTNTVATHLYCIKSLFTYAHRIGYLPVNVGGALDGIKWEKKLAGRILTENEVRKILVLEEDPRNSLILHTLYITGCRVSELVGMQWAHLQERPDEDSGQIWFPVTKTDEPRTVLLPSNFWQELKAFYKGQPLTEPVFVSYKQRIALDPMDVWRIVRAATERANIKGNVSPHWFRHSHATHSLHRGAEITLVQKTLGHNDIRTTSRYLHANPKDSSARYLGF